MKENSNLTPVYKRQLKFEKNKLVMNKVTYVPVPKEFSDSLVSHMKDGSFWEDIISVDGADYMEEKRFKIYEELASILKK